MEIKHKKLHVFCNLLSILNFYFKALIVNVLLFFSSQRLTTINNNIQENVGKDGSTISNNLGGIYDENEVRYKNDNDALNGGPNDVNEEPQNFFKMIFENPAILAG